MTGNSKQIQQLKHEQEKKKKKIENYRKGMKRNLFIITAALTIYSFICLDHGYKTFGSINNFLIATILVWVICIVSHVLIVRNLISKREKEIRTIRGKLYQLMKLDND